MVGGALAGEACCLERPSPSRPAGSSAGAGVQVPAAPRPPQGSPFARLRTLDGPASAGSLSLQSWLQGVSPSVRPPSPLLSMRLSSPHLPFVDPSLIQGLLSSARAEHGRGQSRCGPVGWAQGQAPPPGRASRVWAPRCAGGCRPKPVSRRLPTGSSRLRAVLVCGEGCSAGQRQASFVTWQGRGGRGRGPWGLGVSGGLSTEAPSEGREGTRPGYWDWPWLEVSPPGCRPISGLQSWDPTGCPRTRCVGCCQGRDPGRAGWVAVRWVEFQEEQVFERNGEGWVVSMALSGGECRALGPRVGKAQGSTCCVCHAGRRPGPWRRNVKGPRVSLGGGPSPALAQEARTIG